jgi:hypothetical protein
MPCLEALSLTKTQTTHKTLQNFTFCDILNAGLSGVLLPKLKIFNETCENNLDFPVLVNFLRPRWDNRVDIKPSSIVRLQLVSFDACNSDVMPDVHEIVELQRFVQEGMEITIMINQRCLPAPASLSFRH